MKRQIQFALRDILDSLPKYILNVIQMTIGLVLVCYVFQVGFQYKMIKEKIRNASDREIYMLDNVSTDTQEDKAINGKDSLKNWRILYADVKEKLIKNEKFLEYYVADSDMPFFMNRVSNEYKKMKNKKLLNNVDEINKISVTANFFDVFQLKPDLDDDALIQFYHYKEGIIPVILGADFKKVYKKNDIIEEDDKTKYQVIGFLKENSSYIAPDQTKDLISLDNFVIVPYIQEDDEIAYISFLDNIYISGNDKKIVDEIVQESKALDLLDLQPINYSYQYHAIKRDTNDEIFVNSTFFAIILLFAFVGITGNLLQIIERNKKEFAIHMLCGAKRRYITFRIAVQVLLMTLLSLIPALVFFGCSKAFAATVVFAIAFTGITLICPSVAIKRQTIQTLLKRSCD